MEGGRRQGLTAVIQQISEKGTAAYHGFINSLIVTGHFDAVTVLEPHREARELALIAHGFR
jgi:hypothetical protein